MITYPIKMERVFFRSPAAHVILKATILKSFQKNEFEKALTELLHVHPRLSCTIKEDKNHQIYYETNEHMSIPVSYYSRSNECCWESVVKKELLKPFLMEKELSIRVCVIVDTNEFDFVVVTHHLLGDGLSLLYAFEDFLQIYLHKSKLSPKSSPPMQCSDLPKDSKLNLLTKLMIRRINHLWKKENPLYKNADYPAMFHRYQDHNSSSFVYGKIDNITLQQLYDEAHENEITINSLLVTAILSEINNLSLVTKQEQKVIIATSLRNQLLRNPKNGYGNYSGGISPTLTYQQDLDFWTNAKLIHEQLIEQLSSKKIGFTLSQVFGLIDTSIFDGLFFDSYSDFHSATARKVRKILRLNQKEEGFDISNLGRFSITSNSKLILVKDVVYLPPETINCDITFGVVTVLNQMCISLCYNEHRIDFDTIDILLKHIIGLLKKVCNLMSKGDKNEEESESENVI